MRAATSAFRKSCDDVSEGFSLDTRTTYLELRLVCHIKSMFSTGLIFSSWPAFPHNPLPSYAWISARTTWMVARISVGGISAEYYSPRPRPKFRNSPLPKLTHSHPHPPRPCTPHPHAHSTPAARPPARPPTRRPHSRLPFLRSLLCPCSHA